MIPAQRCSRHTSGDSLFRLMASTQRADDGFELASMAPHARGRKANLDRRKERMKQIELKNTNTARRGALIGTVLALTFAFGLAGKRERR